MEPSDFSCEQSNNENFKHTYPNSLHEQRRLTRRILKQTHWTFDQSLKTRVNQQRHERHKLPVKHALENIHQKTHKKRSLNGRTICNPVKHTFKSNDEQETELGMEQAREEEPRVSINVEKEACKSEFCPSSICNSALHDDETRYTLSSRVSEVRQTVRDALVFGKRYLNEGRNLNNEEIISAAEDYKSKTKENEIPILRATAQYTECRFQNYNKQIDEELERWTRQRRDNAHKTSGDVFTGCEESRQTAGETCEDLREHKTDDDSQAAREEDDSWMDEYRNPLFDEYNEASTSLLHQKSDNHSNSTHNMSKAGVDFQVDDTHDANIQSRNSSCTHEVQEFQVSEPRLDSNESSSALLETVQTMSISRIKFLQDLMLTAMEQFHKERRFRASPVPPSTSEPRYDNLVMEQELRRFINKHEAMELLQQLQKPFSFDSKNQHTRPQTPANKDPNKKPLFIAKEVPSHVKQMRYTLLLEQDALREAKIQKQAKLKLELAKMPPRMELHQRRSESWFNPSSVKSSTISLSIEEGPTNDQQKEEMETRSPGFIPDFKSLHSQWKKRLQRSRASNQRKLTIPLAFNMERRPNRRSSFCEYSKAPTPEQCVPDKRATTSTELKKSSPRSTPDPTQEKKAMPNGTEQQRNDSKKNTKVNKVKRSKLPRTETETPSQYIKARYKQIETQAKEIVAEALKAQGLDFHKYIPF